MFQMVLVVLAASLLTGCDDVAADGDGDEDVDEDVDIASNGDIDSSGETDADAAAGQDGGDCGIIVPDEGVLTPYSTQLHIHGSMSEGQGSMESATLDHALSGIDVIWWTDHDWRITTYRHTSTFSFDSFVEPVFQGEPWKPSVPSELAGAKGALRLYDEATYDDWFRDWIAVIDEDTPYRGTGSLRLQAVGRRAPIGRLLYTINESRMRFRRSLASLVLVDIAVRPTTLRPVSPLLPDASGSTAVVAVTLSNHGPQSPDLLDLVPYQIRYYLSNDETEPVRVGPVVHVPLAYRLGQWNAYTLDVTGDAVAGFPQIDGLDNSLHAIRVGLEASPGVEAEASFDALNLSHEISGQELFVKQRQMLDALEERFPQVIQHQGSEISYLKHLNEFSLGTELIDYDEVFELSGLVEEGAVVPLESMDDLRTFVASHAVEQAHARGGVVSYNHMFGTPQQSLEATTSPEEMAAELLATNAYGADLIEVGYRDRGRTLDAFLEVWDQLLAAQLYLVGTGVSDNHAGLASPYASRNNNLVTWIYAPSTDASDLIEGLRSGQVFFGDITLTTPAADQGDVELQLSTPRGFRMGQIVVTDASVEQVDIFIDGTSVGDVVRIIQSGEQVGTHIADGPTVSHTHDVFIDPVAGAFLRVEVLTASSEWKLLSNPIVFITPGGIPEGGVPAARVGWSLGDLSSAYISGFTLHGASLEDDTLRLEGEADDGMIVIDVHAGSDSMEVVFDGLEGCFRRDAGRMMLGDLSGSGSIDLRF